MVLKGMKELCDELARGYNKNGWYTEINLDRATGEIWGKMMSQHSWSQYPEYSSCVRTDVSALEDEYNNRDSFYSMKDRNDAIREWAADQIAEYNNAN